MTILIEYNLDREVLITLAKQLNGLQGDWEACLSSKGLRLWKLENLKDESDRN